MKRFVAGFLFVVTGVVATPSYATDVINQDQKAYKITIVDGGYTSTKEVSARGSVYGLCGSGPCVFKIQGSEIKAGKDDKLVINGGKLKPM